METFVYTVTRRETGDQYVGISKNPQVRWKSHRWHARHSSRGHFHTALAKYGFDAFDWKVFAKLPTLEEAQIAERILIATTQSTYNSSAGGDGNWGYVPTPETRAKLSAFQKGSTRRPRTPEHRAALGASRRGRSLSEEHKAKISAGVLRSEKFAAAMTRKKPLTDEHKARISAGLQRRKAAKLTAQEKLS